MAQVLGNVQSSYILQISRNRAIADAESLLELAHRVVVQAQIDFGLYSPKRRKTERAVMVTESKRIRIGDWILDPSLNQIEGVAGTVTLEPLAIEVLTYFANHPGDVIGPDELIENLWSRRFVGDSPVYRVMAELRRILGDDARNPRYFETIRKRGYRLVADVEMLDGRSSDSGSQQSTESTNAGSRGNTAQKKATVGLPRFLWIGIALLIVGAAGLNFFKPTVQNISPTIGQPPVIAVIPFEDLTSTESSHIVRSLTDAVATRLAGVSQLRVIAQNSTRQFNKSNESARTMGEQLGAQYLITGTAIRRIDETNTEWLRVNAHLIDAETESYLWSQTYEQPLTDIFKVQDSISESVAQQLDVALFDESRHRAVEGADAARIVAYEHFAKGRDAYSRGFVESDLQAAVDELELAIAEDPTFAQAHATLGLAHLQLYAQYWDRSEERLELARQMIDRSLELDPTLVDGQFGLGSYYLRREMLGPALEHFEYVRLNQPSHTEALTGIAQVYQRQGKLAEAVSALNSAARFDPLNHLLFYQLGQTQIVVGEYSDAEVSLERAIILRPEFIEGYLFKAILYMSWRGDVVRSAAEFRRAAAEIGMENLMEWLLQPGLSSSFRFAGPEFKDALLEWQLDDSDADPASYFIAMAEHALSVGNKDSAKEYYDNARVHLEKTVREYPDEPFFYALLGSAYAGAGRVDEAVAAGKQLLKMAPVSENPWDNADYLWYMAEIYILAGLIDEAIAQTEIALQYPTTLTRDWIRVEPFWNPLRDDPRFQELIESE